MKLPKKTLEISSDVHWVGVKDWDRRMFDRLIPLPNGTSYNSYLIKGTEKTALIDTVNPGFEKILEEKIDQVSETKEIDYLIMNHAEPDHAKALAHLLPKTDGGTIITSKKGKDMAQELHHLPEESIRTVENGNKIDLGGKKLRFINAPWLHWPETMFTFYEEENILFPCDFFGSHLASEKFYDEEMGDELTQYAKSYFGEIMMPFRKMVDQALDKIEDLDIEMIAPSHGPIYKNPEDIVSSYRTWASGKVKEKVLVIYVSMWGSTEKLANTLTDAIASQGVEAVPINLASGDLGKLAGEIVDSAGIVIGTPTVLGGPHPDIQHVTYLAKKLNPPTKYLGVIESHGWSGGAVAEIADMVENMDAEVVGTVEVLGSPKNEDLEETVRLGEKLAESVKE